MTAGSVPPARPRYLGFWSLALGALGVAFYCVPLLGLLLGGAGLAVGVLGLLRSHHRGFTSSGTALSALAVALNLLLPALWPDQFSPAWNPVTVRTGRDTRP